MVRTIREVIDLIQATPDDDATTFRLLAELHLMVPEMWHTLPHDHDRRTEFLARDISGGILEVIRRRGRHTFFGDSLDYSDVYEWRHVSDDEEYVRKFVDESVEVKEEE
jgi:hypothetical protein